MPRYFFHVKRGQVTVLDQEGVELADIVEATAEALERGRQIAMRYGAQTSRAGASCRGACAAAGLAAFMALRMCRNTRPHILV